jgi:hypothetical protein
MAITNDMKRAYRLRCKRSKRHGAMPEKHEQNLVYLLPGVGALIAEQRIS